MVFVSLFTHTRANKQAHNEMQTEHSNDDFKCKKQSVIWGSFLGSTLKIKIFTSLLNEVNQLQ